MSDTEPVNWKLWREISSCIAQVTQDMERSSLNELRLNEVDGVDNEALVSYYKSAAPKTRSGKRKLHGSSPTLLWKKNGPEMTCLATIADLKVHEAKQAQAAQEKADRKTRRFVNQVLLHVFVNIHYDLICRLLCYECKYIIIHCRELDGVRQRRTCVIGSFMKNFKKPVYRFTRTMGIPGPNVAVLPLKPAITLSSTCITVTSLYWVL